jgi:hypothetical protein
MKKFLAAVGLLALIAALVFAVVFPDVWGGWLGRGAGGGSGGGPESRCCRSDEMGCTLKVPGSWTAEARSVGTPAILAEDPAAGRSASLTMIRMRSGEDAAAFGRRFRNEERERLEGYGEHRVGPSQLGGLEGWEVVYTHEKDGRRKVRQVFVARENYAYILTCSTAEERYAEAEPVFRRLAAELAFD